MIQIQGFFIIVKWIPEQNETAGFRCFNLRHCFTGNRKACFSDPIPGGNLLSRAAAAQSLFLLLLLWDNNKYDLSDCQAYTAYESVFLPCHGRTHILFHITAPS